MALSTDGPTPNTETRAMYDELCDMLGITNDLKQPRRSQSVIERRRDQDFPISAGSSLRSSTTTTGSGRPLSMPGQSGLTEVYQSMSADGTAMLATLGLLSDTD